MNNIVKANEVAENGVYQCTTCSVLIVVKNNEKLTTCPMCEANSYRKVDNKKKNEG